MTRVKCETCNEITEATLTEEGEDYKVEYKCYECTICKSEIRIDG